MISFLRSRIPRRRDRLIPGIGIAFLSLVLVWGESGASLEERDEIIYPAVGRNTIQSVGSSDDEAREYSYWRVLMIGAILSGGAALFAYQLIRRGRIKLPMGSSESGLRLNETRMLGNKQFLVVVEYGGQKMLLGVGPGFIEHLCYLDSSLSEDGAAVPEFRPGLERRA